MKFYKKCAAVLVFSLFAFDLSSEADTSVSLKEIDGYIAEKQYNAALKALTEYMSAYPDDFDRAQNRVEKIMSVRNKYNKNAGKLVELIKNSSGDRTDKLNHIQFMEKAEGDPTATVQDFTTLARRTITLGEVLISYNNIMREGIALVRSEKYPEAVKKFQEGFDIKNEKSDIVFEYGTPTDRMDQGILVVYENDITSPVKKSVDTVNETVDSGFRNYMNACERAYREYIQAASARNIANTERAFERVKAAFGNYADFRNKVTAEIKVLEKADKLANERNPLLLGTSYITFYQKFVQGDSGNADSGILGALDAYWNTRVEDMKRTADGIVFAAMEKFQTELGVNTAYDASEAVRASSQEISLAQSFIDSSLKVHGLYDLLKDKDGKTYAGKYNGYTTSLAFIKDYLKNLEASYGEVLKIAAEKAEDYSLEFTEAVPAAELNEKLNTTARLEAVKKRAEEINAAVSKAYETHENFYKKRERRLAQLREMDELTGGTLNLENSEKRKTAGVLINDEIRSLSDDVKYVTDLNNESIRKGSEYANKIWGYLAQAYCYNGKKNYDGFVQRIDSYQKLLDGTLDEELNLVKKYPAEAKDESQKLSAEIDAEKKLLVSQRGNLNSGMLYAGKNPDYDNGKVTLENLIGDLDSLILRNREITRTADNAIRQYNRAFEEGMNQYNLALAAFKRNDFDGANAYVDKASEKLAEALEYEYSDKARIMREETLAELAGQILAAENEQVIRDVFALKEEATNYYYASNFDAAEATLVKAQTRWAKTNPDPDEEIEDLLTVVRNVKSLAFGRVLSVSDPHYPELSYSLDMAKLSFERGIAFKKSGKKAEAEEAFNTAIANIRNIQNVYPLNKEARLISLKIQQEIDPAGFPKQFENQYQAAKNNRVMNEKLADLQDLYAIKPDYPGLKQEIYNLEEQMGMHPKKTIKADSKNKAVAKVNEARSIFRSAGNDENRLNRALTAVNEAIALDSTNKDAKNLKLEIQLKMGSNATAILSQADEKLYAEAGRLFNQRKFAEANDIMNTLWNSAAAKRSRKVIDLRNRILRRL